MNRSITLPFVLVLAGVVNAQPVLTFADNAPVPGNSYTLRYGPYVAPGSAGADQTWDLSMLDTDSTDVIVLVDPATTVNGASFPSATVSETGSDAVMYFRSAVDGMYLAGSDADGLLIPYSDEGRYLPFPCTYADTWNDAVAADFQLDDLDVSRTGTIEGVADGYGTLIMPSWTATDVLRVHWHEETSDVTDNFAMESVYDSYLYFVAGQSHPIVQLVHTEVSFLGGTTIHEHAQWVDALSTGTTDGSWNDNDLSVFPVPAKGLLNIALPAEFQGMPRITVTDAQGRTVKDLPSMTLSNGLGQVDISRLPAGIHLLKVTDTQGARVTRRFIVE